MKLVAFVSAASACLLATPALAATITQGGQIVIPGIPGTTRSYLPTGTYEVTPTTAYHNANLQTDTSQNRGWLTGYCINGVGCGGAAFYETAGAALAASGTSTYSVPFSAVYGFTLNDPNPQDNVGNVTLQFTNIDPDYVRFRNIVNDALRGNCSFFTGIAQVECAVGAVVNLREQPGNSTDELLRDAEYFMRNWVGGAKLNEMASGNGELGLDEFRYDVVLQNPFAVAGYNTVKAIADFLGAGALTRANPGNPNSAPGGFDASVDGFLDGLNGVDINGAIDHRIQELLPPGQVATPITTPVGSQQNREVFVETAEQNTYIGLDPTIGETYVFNLLAGPGVNGFSLLGDALPSDLLLTISDGFGNFASIGIGEQLISDMIFDIFGVDYLLDFTVTTESLFDGEYVLGLSFADSGTFIVGRTQVLDGDPSVVPLPPAMAMMAGGVLLLAGIGRRRRTGPSAC